MIELEHNIYLRFLKSVMVNSSWTVKGCQKFSQVTLKLHHETNGTDGFH